MKMLVRRQSEPVQIRRVRPRGPAVGHHHRRLPVLDPPAPAGQDVEEDIFVIRQLPPDVPRRRDDLLQVRRPTSPRPRRPPRRRSPADAGPRRPRTRRPPGSPARSAHRPAHRNSARYRCGPPSIASSVVTDSGQPAGISMMTSCGLVPSSSAIVRYVDAPFSSANAGSTQLVLTDGSRANSDTGRRPSRPLPSRPSTGSSPPSRPPALPLRPARPDRLQVPRELPDQVRPRRPDRHHHRQRLAPARRQVRLDLDDMLRRPREPQRIPDRLRPLLLPPPATRGRGAIASSNTAITPPSSDHENLGCPGALGRLGHPPHFDDGPWTSVRQASAPRGAPRDSLAGVAS